MAIGTYRHCVRLESPSTPVPDGQGGYTETWSPLNPADWNCSIEPATSRDLEAVASGTILPSGARVLRGRFHPGITTKTRVRFDARTLNVIGIANPQERGIETLLVCAEVVE